MYKLVILDIDNTLITNHRRLTKRTRKVIEQVIEKGVKVVISTGRNKRMANKVLSKFNDNLIHACAGGAEIYNDHHDYIYDGNMKIEEVRSILKKIENKSCFYQLVLQNSYYKYLPSEEAKKYDVFGHNSLKSSIINKYVGIYKVNRYEDFFSERFNRTSEIIIGGSQEVLSSIKGIIEKEFPHLHARDDLWESYIFIGNKNNTKAKAMAKICEHLEIDIQQVIAIGDDFNDVDMIRAAGLGIAMGNAIQEVKDVADDVTYKNSEDGVAVALEHYILNNKRTKIMA